MGRALEQLHEVATTSVVNCRRRLSINRMKAGAEGLKELLKVSAGMKSQRL